VQVSVLCDQISSPALAGTEAVGASVLLKAMAEAFGHSVERVKDEVFPGDFCTHGCPSAVTPRRCCGHTRF
jgi:hypothetical protein